MQVRFNAFDKNSSDSHSRFVEFETFEELKEEWDQFVAEVPFSKWYDDNTNESGEDEVDDMLEKLD